MKKLRFIVPLGLLAVTLALPICVSAADKPTPATDSPSADKDAKKNTTTLVLNFPPEKVHAATLEALAAIGCDIKKDTADYVEGKRANKIGLAVGSGGEKLLVSIKPVGTGQTELKVVTKKTMMGYVGQKLWNEEVANHIRDALK